MRALAIVFERDAGPGVFAEASAARGVELDSWIFDGRAAPPGEPSGYDAVLVFGGSMHPDHEDAHPWLREAKALLARAARARHAAARRLPGRSASGRGGWAALSPRARAGARLVRGGGDTRGGARSAARAARPRLHGLRVAQVRVRPPPRRNRAGPQRSVPSGLPARRRRLGHPVPRRGHRRGRRRLDRRRSPKARTRPASSATSTQLRERTRRAMGPWNELGRGLCERFLDAAATRA